MGFLAPLYIAGLAAIALPILFHLIRRTPQGKQYFSSLMFLTPSPPRLTRRSRLSNLLLLLLRASAFLLLALAFARPFFNSGPALDLFQSPGRRMAILVDTSASMRRPDLWNQALAKVDAVLATTTPADEVALLLFDNHTRTAFSFKEWNDADPARRAALLHARLAQAQPSWNPTDLGDAVATAADLVAESPPRTAAPAAATPPADRIIRQVVLVSDLQQGGHVENLQGHQWPKGVLLDVQPLSARGKSNASLQWVKSAPDADTPTPATMPLASAAATTNDLRVRITNDPTSTVQQFSLAWATAAGPIAATQPAPLPPVYVPPGRSVIVRIAKPVPGPAAPDRLVLSGDDADFDNTLFIAPPHVETLRILYLGADAADDPTALRYYLQTALAATPARKVEFLAPPLDAPLPAADLNDIRLAVVAAPLPAATLDQLAAFIRDGHDALLVLKDLPTAQADATLMKLSTPITAAPSGPNTFSLLARVDLQNPLFAPFADARFADFTKIHFWNHRVLTLPADSDLHAIAAFDNNDPFLLERPLGKGRLRIMTAGWQPADSQLALSTKFVPLVEGLVRGRDDAAGDAQYTVGDPLPLPAAEAADAARILITPDGRRIELPAAATAYDTPDRPGIYRLSTGTAPAKETLLAVNLAPDESRTAPLDPADLERWGATLGTGKPTQKDITEQRRLRTSELENRQKLWRWLILAVLGLLALETALAGRLAPRTLREQVAL